MSQKEMHNFDLATNPVLFGFPEISKFVIKIYIQRNFVQPPVAQLPVTLTPLIKSSGELNFFTVDQKFELIQSINPF